MVDLAGMLRDLEDEGEDLDRLVAPLDDDAWRAPTPAAGWTIAHQVAHLASTDSAALVAVTDEDRFQREVLTPAAKAAEAGRNIVDDTAEAGAERPAAEILRDWRSGRAALATALTARGADPAAGRIPWFGPPMSVPSMVTARLMETWAHGLDVADALGVVRPPTARLRHIAHLGVRTRDFAYLLRGRTPPAEPFRVELAAPDGDRWVWGPADAEQAVSGPAEDFCLVVTQRRHLGDLALTARGPDAQEWLTIAQAFAGTPGPGRPRATP